MAIEYFMINTNWYNEEGELIDDWDEKRKLLEDYFNGVPSAQPDSCEYCNEDVNGFVTPLEKNGHAFVRFSMNGWELSLRANGWHGSAKIRYCPMCGRRLTDE